MPTLDEELQSSPIKVAPSAVLELMWVLHFMESRHSHEGDFAPLEALRLRLGPVLTGLRADNLTQYSSEVIVLAHRSGTLFDLDLRRFFERFDQALEDRSKLPSLLSEKPAERKVVRDRLERLSTDRELRKRYVDLLSTAWRAVEPEWQTQGRPAVVAEVERWTRALADGGTYLGLLGVTRLWPGRPDLEDTAAEAAPEGRLVLSPCWFGGKIHMFELDGTVLMGRGIRFGGHSYRKLATEVASSMKVLADPTRVTILLRLAQHPASVTELARQLKLSQPTVSSHVQVLREAGLIEERAVGRSAELSASEEGLRRLLSGSEEAMLRAFK
jgi:DNA-binding transcriptional ArsR family regulator